MRIGYQRKRPIAEINVVPYIDVMLVLLVIFMITAPLLNQGVTVELPKAEAKVLHTKDHDPIIVSIDEQGLLYLNLGSTPSTPLNPDSLQTRVAAELRLAKEAGYKQNVLVKGDLHVNYGQVVSTMVLLQKAGAPTLGLMTQPAPTLTHQQKAQTKDAV